MFWVRKSFSPGWQNRTRLRDRTGFYPWLDLSHFQPETVRCRQNMLICPPVNFQLLSAILKMNSGIVNHCEKIVSLSWGCVLAEYINTKKEYFLPWLFLIPQCECAKYVAHCFAFSLRLLCPSPIWNIPQRGHICTFFAEFCSKLSTNWRVALSKGNSASD